ncbi:MAG: hypothetical protein ABGW90_12590, partial [Martelella sp.]
MLHLIDIEFGLRLIQYSLVFKPGALRFGFVKSQARFLEPLRGDLAVRLQRLHFSELLFQPRLSAALFVP